MLSIVPCGYVKETARGKEKAATEVTAYVSYIRLLANCQERVIDCIGVSSLRHELYALFNNVVIPNLNTEITDMFNYAG